MRHSEPRRPPSALLLPVVLLALLVASALVGFLIWQWIVLQESLPAVATVLRVLFFAIPVTVGGGAGVVGLLTAYRRFADHRYIQAHHVTQLERARTQVAPLASSFTYHNAPRIEGISTNVENEPLALPPPSPTVPTFSELLDQGRIGPGRPLLLGFEAETGAAIEGSWRDLYSCGVGALQGAGKSWLAAFLLAQSAAAGGRLIICDLHAGNAESLADRVQALSPSFMCAVASTPDAILSALKLASDKLQQRKAGRGGHWPIIVAVDEWTSLLRTPVGEALPGYLEDISEQGRKYNVNALLSAQGWTKDTAGVVRNRLTSNYVLRQRPDEARYQLGLPATQIPLDVRLLPDATGYLLTTSGDLKRIVIPRMTEADIARAGMLIPQESAMVGPSLGFRPATALATTPSATVASGKPDGSLMVAKTNQATTAVESPRTVSPEAARVLDLLREGNDLPAIVYELRTVKSSEGRRYQTALAEITNLLREATK